MRTYIFTDAELDAVKKWLETGRRNPSLNKLMHNVRRNNRLLNDIQIFLTLVMRTEKRKKEEPKMVPGRPPKRSQQLA